MKNLLHKKGKATVISLSTFVIVCIAVWLVSCLITPTKAADEKYPTKTFIIPYKGESYKTIVMRNRDNGNAINSTTGASASDTTWDSAELAGAQHAITKDWVFTIPAHNIAHIYFTIYDVAPASITKATTTSYSPLLYNPNTGLAFTDTNPIAGNQVNTSAVNYD